MKTLRKFLFLVIWKELLAILKKESYHLFHPHLTSPVKGGGILLPSPEEREVRWIFTWALGITGILFFLFFFLIAVKSSYGTVVIEGSFKEDIESSH